MKVGKGPMSEELSPDKLAAADRRFTAAGRRIDSIVYSWRTSNIHCTAEGCHKGDTTTDAAYFAQRLFGELTEQGVSIHELADALTAAVIKLAAVPVEPPKHLWRADNACTCGWTGTEQAWVEHAGDDCLVLPWYAAE